MKVRTAVNITDCHIPWHDKRAFEILISIMTDIDPDEINILGDFLDFYGCSLHDKLPATMSLKERFTDEIYQGNQVLERIRELFPKARINYIEGNHEYRLLRYIVAKAPALYDIVKLPDLLKFKDRHIEYHPFGRHQLVSCLGTDLFMRHQPYSQADYCAGNTLKKKFTSLSFGHTHREQSYTSTDARGRRISCYSSGWLGDVDAPVFDYVDTQSWVLGFQIVTAIGDTWICRHIAINDYKAVVDGQVYYNEESDF